MIMPKHDPGIIFKVKVIKPCGESHLSKHSKKRVCSIPRVYINGPEKLSHF